MTAPTTQVWRLAAFGRSIAGLIIATIALMAVVAWVQAARDASWDAAVGAVVVTGTAAAVGLVLWWTALRPGW